ncbi:MAG: two-component system response regulator LytT, partial [Saprospiraceae bacterium]
MQILIVEDEPRAASQLQDILANCGFEYQLLDLLDTVEDTISWFQNHQAPDLVFMDIQLADGLSFEIFQKVEIDAPIIFTTAFDQYAIQAFKVNSVDY